MKKQKLPSFLNIEKDRCNTGREALQDFAVSWIIACSDKGFYGEVHDFAKKIVFYMLYGKNDIEADFDYMCDDFETNFEVSEVSIWRQAAKIDVWVDLTVLRNGVAERHILNIENKFYTGIKEKQMKDNVSSVKDYYTSCGEKVNIINLLIFPEKKAIEDTSDFNVVKKVCKKLKYKLLTIKGIVEALSIKDTNEALFDTFWLNGWKIND